MGLAWTSEDLRLAVARVGLGWRDSLQGWHLTAADLAGAILRDADLSGADLTGAYLRGAVLDGANLLNCSTYDADVSKTILEWQESTT